MNYIVELIFERKIEITYEYVWICYEYDYTKEVSKFLSRYNMHVKHVYSKELNISLVNWNNSQKMEISYRQASFLWANHLNFSFFKFRRYILLLI